ncbi:hypothetical protein BG006_008923 [Podila minutissima]|uniref:DUF726-domain-containing protein n=1 Tax=Podila minutissima TaxID=64525 RepID=A0A9P5SF32_9FUNG|nr:hypothetical protein BG006_008923 [Podila minutissima]
MNKAIAFMQMQDSEQDTMDEPSTVCSIETFAEHWSEAQAFSVATLAACAITALETTGVDTLPWKHTFLRSLFRQLGITSREEQEMLLSLQENGSYQDCNLQVLADPLLPKFYSRQPSHMDHQFHQNQNKNKNQSPDVLWEYEPELEPEPHPEPERRSSSSSSISSPISSPPSSPSQARKSFNKQQQARISHSSSLEQIQEQEEFDIRTEVINDLVYIGLGFEPSTKTRKNVYIPIPDHNGQIDLPPAYSEKDPTSIAPPSPPRGSTEKHPLEPSSLPPQQPPRTPSILSTSTSSTTSSKKKHASGRVPPLEYDARARAVIFIMCNYLLISYDAFMTIEKQIAQHLYFYQQELFEAEKLEQVREQERERQRKEEEKILEQQRIRDEQLILEERASAPTGRGGFFSNFKKSGFYQNIASVGSSSSAISESSTVSQRTMTQQEAAMQNQAQASMQELEKKKKTWRYLATGLGVAAGATVIGLTGGLAAPLVAAGATVLIGSGAAVLGTTAGLAVMTSLFGLAGGGLAGYKIHRRNKDLKVLSFVPIVKDPTLPVIPSLHLAIVISGYLFDESEITSAWEGTAEHALNGNDVFHLTFEPAELVTLGNAVKIFVATEAVRMVSTQVIQQTVFAALASALVLPLGLMRAGDLIDNPWVVAMDRARKSGYVLADILMERVQGARPTTLIGYSTGAIVIWECLLELANRKEYGLVNSVVLLGAPIKTDLTDKWKAASSVVANRFVNGYSKKDVVLGSIFRLHALGLDVAGLHPVESVSRIENVDLSDIVGGHLEYRENLNMVISLLGVL